MHSSAKQREKKQKLRSSLPTFEEWNCKKRYLRVSDAASNTLTCRI